MNESPYSPEEASGTWVYLEHRDGKLEGVSLELLGRARELARETGESLTALLLGERVEPLAAEAIGLPLEIQFTGLVTLEQEIEELLKSPSAPADFLRESLAIATVENLP